MQPFLSELFQAHKKTLSLIIKAYQAGDIGEATYESMRDDEGSNLRAELEVVKIIGKKAAQDAVNAALDVIWKAVKEVIKF